MGLEMFNICFLLIMCNIMQGQNNVDSDEDIVESDIELDQPDVLQPDTDPPQKVGNCK